jgi:hypothetical protein
MHGFHPFVLLIALEVFKGNEFELPPKKLKKIMMFFTNVDKFELNNSYGQKCLRVIMGKLTM